MCDVYILERIQIVLLIVCKSPKRIVNCREVGVTQNPLPTHCSRPGFCVFCDTIRCKYFGRLCFGYLFGETARQHQHISRWISTWKYTHTNDMLTAVASIRLLVEFFIVINGTALVASEYGWRMKCVGNLRWRASSEQWMLSLLVV